MKEDEIREIQVRANNGIASQQDVKTLVHELFLTRQLCKDMAQTCQFVIDTVGIVFGDKKTN